MADVANYTTIAPVMQTSEIVSLASPPWRGRRHPRGHDDHHRGGRRSGRGDRRGDATVDQAAIDICGPLDIELVNRLTGESFSVADRYEDESCRLTGDVGDGVVS